MNDDLHQLKIAIKSVLITEEDIKIFVALSGDMNPIHSDEVYASKSIFKKRIAPGIMIASYISAVIANELPGPGTIYLEQNLRFEAPVYIGDTITTTVTVLENIRCDRLRLKTICTNQHGRCVLTGTALVKTPICP